MIGYILLGIVVLFLAVILIRAAMFKPKAQPEVSAEEVTVDADTAARNLQQLVQCKTVSYNDHSLEDEAEFRKLLSLLPELYPHVFFACEYQEFPDRGILLRWPGKEKGDPAVMMSHYDVVPADEEKWEMPPFAGIIKDGVLWGRGTLDTKITMASALYAANTLIAEGFVPQHDVYFAFSGGEEVNGKGAVHIVDYFASKGITPSMVVDEGGAVVKDVFPGVKENCAMIGIAEKGMINAEYSVKSSGGHASAPPVKTPITTLAKACRSVIEHPFKMDITMPAAMMFDTLARRSSFLFKLIFANLWCFKPVFDLICKASGGEMNALVRTTTAFTMMQGSNARNVIPTEASLVSNMRLNPSDSVASAESYLNKVVNDPDVTITVLESNEPSRISRTDCDGWQKVASAVASTWRGCVVTPYLMVQCSDSRHYGRISDKVYRFSAMDLTSEERRSIHGNNERIRLETVAKAAEFYVRLLKSC